VVFDAFTRVPDARCRAEVRAATLEPDGFVEIASDHALDLDYELAAQLELVWPARCVSENTLQPADCERVAAALQLRAEVQEALCSAQDDECACRLRVEQHVSAQHVERARDLFLTRKHCVSGARLTMDDATTTWMLERDR